MASDDEVLRLAIQRGMLTPEQAALLRAAVDAGAAETRVETLAAPRAEAAAGAAETRADSSAAPGGQAAPPSSATRVDPPATRGHGLTSGPIPAPTGPSTPAIRFGKYVLLGELGRGGMGVVHRARDVELGREVALKMLPAIAAAGREDVERLFREARTAATLEHPGIVPIHDAGWVEGVPYLAMAFVRGRTLAALWESGESPSVRERVHLVHAAAAAVAHAHARGVIHRDLKPANLMVDPDGGVHVLDFGLARRLDDAHKLTASGQVVGTPSYMAPEQTDGTGVGPAADAWALGVILYEALTRRLPFEGESVLEIMQRAVVDDPVPPRRRDPRIPRDLETVCLKALAKEAAGRYPTARELADELAQWLAGEAIAARPERAWEKALRWTRRHRVLAAAAAVVAIAAGAAAVSSVRAHRADEARAAALDRTVRTLRETARLSLDAVLTARRLGGVMDRVGERFLPPLQQAVRETGDLAGESAEPHHHLGRLYRALLRDEDARREQDAALAVEPDYAPSRYERGLLRFAAYRRRLDSCRTEMLRARAARGGPGAAPAQVPTNEELEAAHPDLLEAKAAARDDLKAAADQEGRWPAAPGQSFSARGMLAFLEGRRAEAAELLGRALEAAPGLDEAIEARAALAGLEDRWEEAVDWFEKGIAADPGHTPHRVGLADAALVAADRIEAAGGDGGGMRRRGLEATEGRIPDDPEEWRLWLHAGLLRCREAEARADRGSEAETDLKKSLASFDRALALRPKSVVALYGRATVCHELGRRAVARGEDPRTAYAEALGGLERARELDPKHVGAANNLAGVVLDLAAAMHARGEAADAEFARGVAAYERVLALTPRLAEVAANLSFALRQWGDARMERGLDPEPEYERAVAAGERAVALGPRSALAASILGDAWQARGHWKRNRGQDPAEDYGKALAEYERTLALHPRQTGAAANQAMVHLALGDARRARGEDPAADYLRARSACERALEINPGAAEAANNLGLACRSLGDAKAARGEDPGSDYRQAIASFDRALGLQADYSAAANNRASAWVALGDAKRARSEDPASEYREAIAGYDRALADNPRNASATHNRALLLRTLGNGKLARGEDPTPEYRQALAGFARAREINPRYAEAICSEGDVHQALADVARARGGDATADLDRAAAAFERALELEPHHLRAAVHLGNVHLARAEAELARGRDPVPDWGRALAQFDRALAGQPRSAELIYGRALVHHRRAALRADRGEDATAEFEEAVAGYEAAVTLHPRLVEAINNQAAVFQALGDLRLDRKQDPMGEYERALAGYERALAVRPGHLAAVANRLRMLDKLGRLLSRSDAVAARGRFELGVAAFAALSEPDAARLRADRSLRTTLISLHAHLARLLVRAAADATAGPGEAQRLRELAWGNLECSIELGWKDRARLEADPELSRLREDPRWPTLLERMEK